MSLNVLSVTISSTQMPGTPLSTWQSTATSVTNMDGIAQTGELVPCRASSRLISQSACNRSGTKHIAPALIQPADLQGRTISESRISFHHQPSAHKLFRQQYHQSLSLIHISEPTRRT